MHKLYRVYRYALFLLERFKYLILAALVVFVIATLVLYFRHPDQKHPATHRKLGEVSFGVFELMFASEPALPYPKGSVLSQVVYFSLPVLNILGLAAAVAQFTQIFFDRGLYNRAQARHADGHVILCGLGRLGREVLKQLDQRHHMKRSRDIVIVENGSGVEQADDELIRREPIIPVLHGDMTHAAVLRAAGIERAAAVLLLTGNDTTNLEAALLANELNPKVRVVLRMSNSRVSQRLEAMFRRSQVRNFQLIDSVEGSAPHCVGLSGDRAGAGEACAVLGAASAGARGHVVVCGLGRLGFGVVRLLKGRTPLVVVDQDDRIDHADEPAMTDAPAVPLVRGDMTLRRVLEQARVAEAAAVLLLTSRDAENLEAAMVVHELNPTVRIVMRITNSRISRRLDVVLREVFGETLRVIDPSEHAAPLFVDAVRASYTGASGAEKVAVARAGDALPSV
jgi:Trk K+ transport system NAD-binding subunit